METKTVGESVNMIDELLKTNAVEGSEKLLDLFRRNPSLACTYVETKKMIIEKSLLEIMVVTLTLSRIQSEHIELQEIFKNK